MTEEGADLFDLAQAPLFRFAAHLQTDDTWRITFTQVCHAITEGWSYHRCSCASSSRRSLTGRSATGPSGVRAGAGTVRYADFIAGELESLAGGVDGRTGAAIVAEYARFELPAGWAATATAPAMTAADGGGLRRPRAAAAGAGRASARCR